MSPPEFAELPALLTVLLLAALVCGGCRQPRRPVGSQGSHKTAGTGPRTRREAAEAARRTTEPGPPPGRRPAEERGNDAGCTVSFFGEGTLIDCTYTGRCPSLLTAVVAQGDSVSLVPARDDGWSLQSRRARPPHDPLASALMTFDGREGLLDTGEENDVAGICVLQTDRAKRIAERKSVRLTGVSVRRLFQP